MLNSLGPCMIEGDWDPGFMIKLQAKDLRIASAAMEASDAPHPGTALTTKLFCAAADAGLGEDGTQRLAQLLGWNEKRALALNAGA